MAADDECMEAELELLRTTTGSTGFKGVIQVKPDGTAKPYQARVYDKVKKAQRPIPGLYVSAEEAARAAVKFVRDGCPWPETAANRQRRGEVSSTPPFPCLLAQFMMQPSTLACA